MNFKERGITVGDLLLFILFIISTIFIINKLRENEKQAYLFKYPNEIQLLKWANYCGKESQFLYHYKIYVT